MNANDIEVGVTYTGCNKYGDYGKTGGPLSERKVLAFCEPPIDCNYYGRVVKWLEYHSLHNDRTSMMRVDTFAKWANHPENETMRSQRVEKIKQLLQELNPEELKEVLEPYGLLHT